MNQMREEFRERLLQAEQTTPALRERYDKEIRAMLQKQLTGVRRWMWLGAAAMGIGFAALFGTLAIILPREFPLYGRLGFGAGALFGIGWAILGIRVVWRGSVDLRSDNGAAAGMAWGLPLVLATFAMMSAPDNIVGLRMLVSLLVFLIMGAVFLLRYAVEQSELKTQEKLLEIEYRLAEMAETRKREKPLPPARQE